MAKSFMLGLMVLTLVAAPGCARLRKPKAPAFSSKQKNFRKADTVTASQLLPLVNRSATFRYELGPHAGESIGYYMTTDGNGVWYSTLENITSLQLRRGDDGALLVEGVADYPNATFLQYSPPMRLLPPTMGHHTTVVRQTRMFFRKTPDGKIRKTADCRYKVQMLGRQRLPTAAGERDAYIVRIDRQYTLGMTKMSDTTWLGFDMTYGLVAQRYEQHTTKMRVLKRQQHWSLVFDALQ